MKTDYILNIDALEGLKSLPDNSIDFVFCDYPFSIPKAAGDYVEFIKNISVEIKRVLKENCVFLIVNNPPNIWKTREAYNEFKHRETIVLIKKMALRPAWNFGYQHNVLMTFINGEDRRYKWNGTKKNADRTMETDVIENFQSGYAGKGIGRHNQAMPLKLVKRFIEIYSNPGDVVLDPFMGSGSTAIGCIQQGRKYVGFELNEKYFKLINKRILQETQPVLFDREQLESMKKT